MFPLYKLFVAIILISLSSTTVAHGYNIADLVIEHPVMYAVPPISPVAGGYMTIKNTGTTDDRLIAAKSTFSKLTQIHEIRVENDVMKMQELKNGIVIPAGETVTLQRGGLHIMFMQLQETITINKKYAATLIFEKAGKLNVDFTVKKPQAQ